VIEKISKFEKWKKWLLIACVVITFALLKSFGLDATNSINGVWLSLLLFLGYGIFYWLVFEVLIGFFYSGLKFKVENKITLAQFNNIFRFAIIFVNIVLFGLSKLIISINFYANIFLLIAHLVALLVYLGFMWWVLKKYFLKEVADKKLEMSYFGFVFMYLFLHTIMWGVL